MSSGLLLVAATPMELGRIAEALPLPDDEGLKAPTWRGDGWTALACGIGKTASAATLSRFLSVALQPNLILHLGIAGGRSDLAIGDLVVAREEIDADLGVRGPSGWSGLEALGLDGSNSVALGSPETEQLHQLLLDAGHPCHLGPCFTSDTVSGTVRMGAGRCQRFGALCESMEGHAVAWVGDRAGIQTVELRAISNTVGARDSFQLEVALTALDQAIETLLQSGWWQGQPQGPT